MHAAGDALLALDVILYDADCGLCCRSIEFLAQRDVKGRYRFAALGSETGQRLLREHGLPPEQTETVVLVHDGRAYVHSSAALQSFKGMRAPWPLMRALLGVPRPIRDGVYEFVARRRHKWFGGAETCPAPSEALRARMLDKEG